MAYDRACPCGLRRCTALVAEPGPCNENVCAHPLVRDDLCYCRVIHRCEVHVHSIIMAVLLPTCMTICAWRSRWTSQDSACISSQRSWCRWSSVLSSASLACPASNVTGRIGAYTLIGAIIFTIYNVVACAVGVEGVASALLAQHLPVSDSVQCVTHSSVFDTMWNEEETSGWSRRLQGRRDVFFTSSSDAA